MCHQYQITVIGKVQGVWFRKYTKEQAEALNLVGSVQNLPNGNVYIEVESDNPKILKQFTDWLYTGSPLSKVEKVEINAMATCHNFTQFEIIR